MKNSETLIKISIHDALIYILYGLSVFILFFGL